MNLKKKKNILTILLIYFPFNYNSIQDSLLSFFSLHYLLNINHKQFPLIVLIEIEPSKNSSATTRWMIFRRLYWSTATRHRFVIKSSRSASLANSSFLPNAYITAFSNSAIKSAPTPERLLFLLRLLCDFFFAPGTLEPLLLTDWDRAGFLFGFDDPQPIFTIYQKFRLCHRF